MVTKQTNMTEVEYKAKQQARIEQDYLNNKLIQREYADAHNPYKVGDIIKDHMSIIKIEKIGYQYESHRLPTCIYHGIGLKKDKTPKKNGLMTAIYQSNIEA